MPRTATTKIKPPSQKRNPRETVYLNSVTLDMLRMLHDQYPRRTKSDLINAAIEHLFHSGYETGLDGNLLPINPSVYVSKLKGGSTDGRK
ncbi:MAG: hypothetical protein KC588_02895 [Nitrospira sp.]|nr:hypothetical protein [Nitrospira sp.]